MNMTRTSMNNIIILVTRRSRNMIKKQIKQHYTYWALGKTNGIDETTTVIRSECSRQRRRR